MYIVFYHTYTDMHMHMHWPHLYVITAHLLLFATNLIEVCI